jgi:hypothetical protein
MALPGRARSVSLRLVATSAPEAAIEALLICLACGDDLPAALARSGSLRCHDCRSEEAPLESWLVHRQRSLGRANRRRQT